MVTWSIFQGLRVVTDFKSCQGLSDCPGREEVPGTSSRAVLTSTGGFVLAESASKNAEPGETLYPVKLATERIKANLPASDNEKGRYLVQQTNISTDETINAAGGADSVGTETISGTPERYLAETGNPGKSGQAPGQQPPAAGDTNPGNGNSGKSDQAPGQHPPASGDTGSGGSGNSGKSDQAPDQQPPAAGETNPGNGDSGKSGEAPGQQPSTPGNTNVPERGKSGK
jgi:hypothetical protein